MRNELTEAHYDTITDGWSLVMGEAFHYGVFADDEAKAPSQSLDRATARLNEVMLAAAGPLPATPRVLDVGCGIGGPARWLAATIGAQVLGLTNSEVGVQEAVRLSGGSRAVRFEVGDAHANGQPDASFDLVWVMESSHLMTDKPRMLRECARVLVPGGRLVLCDQLALRPFDVGELFALRDEVNCLDRAFGRARMEPPAFYQAELQRADFADVVFDDLTEATRPTLTAWPDNVQKHRPRLVELVGAQAADDLVRACGILDGFWGDRIGYGMLSATRR